MSGKKIKEEIRAIVKPLLAIADAGSLKMLELELDYYGIELDKYKGGLDEILEVFNELSGLREQIEDLKIDDGASFLEAITKLKQITSRILAFVDRLNEIDFGEELRDAGRRIGEDILNITIIDYLKFNRPKIFYLLQLLGIVSSFEGKRYGVQTEFETLILEHLIAFFKDPLGLLKKVYGWGGDQFLAHVFFVNLAAYLKFYGKFTYLIEPTEEYLSALGSEPGAREDSDYRFVIPIVNFSKEGRRQEMGIALMQITTPEEPFASKLALFPYATAESVNQEVRLDSGLQINFRSTAEANSDFAVILTPERIELKQLSEEVDLSPLQFSASMGVEKYSADENRKLLLGSEQGARLEIGSVGIHLGVKIDIRGKNFTPEFEVFLPLKNGLFLIKSGDADGFLSKILPKDGIKSTFDIAVGWSFSKGLHFAGNVGLTFEIPKHVDLGPVRLVNFQVDIAVENNSLSGRVGTSVNTKLGPLNLLVEHIGFSALARLDQERKGNMGLFDLDFRFKPPTGIALSLSTPTLSGGGYIRFDPANERYAGAMELVLKDRFILRAMAIIETRLPDDPDGYSLLILINTEFNPPISLGMNFYLSGLGGIVGLHRTVNIEALRDAVKEDKVDQLLFPKNVVENITDIIRDSQEYFPAKEGQFVIGLMALITWNNPPLMRMELGLVIEFDDPTRLVIVGLLKCQLPKPDKHLVQIQVNFLGYIDFDNKELSIDAVLFDSHVMGIGLEGDIALRIFWGKKRAFVLSVGGFHPQYSPPAHLRLRPMKRLTMSLVNKKHVKLIFKTYFAITSNTVQFGAEFELLIRFRKFKITGELAFDVLFQFSPFRFVALIKAKVAVKYGSKSLILVDLSLELQGPGPWIAKGRAKFKILFLKVKVRFNKRFGKRKDASIPGVQLLPLLVEALQQPGAWTGRLPGQRQPLVSLREGVPVSGGLLLHPNARVSVQQQLIPLEIGIDRYGKYRVEDIRRARITQVRLGSQRINTIVKNNSGHEEVRDYFAPSAFRELSDADKLQAPEYKELISGHLIQRTERLQTSRNGALRKAYAYSFKYSKPDEPADLDLVTRSEPQIIRMDTDALQEYARRGLLQRSPLAQYRQRAGQTGRVILQAEQYVVAERSGLEPTDGLVASSRIEAEELQQEVLLRRPELEGNLVISPLFQTTT